MLQRQQRERDGGGWHGDRRERRGDAQRVGAVDERADDNPARERDAEEDRVSRVDEREREPGRATEINSPRRLPRVREDERDRRRDQQLPRGRRWPHQQRVGAAVARRSAISATCAAAVTAPSAGERKSTASGLERHEDGDRNEQRALVLDDERGSTPASFVTAARKACQSGNAYPGCRPPPASSSNRKRLRGPSSTSLRTRARWNGVSPRALRGDVPEQQPEHETGAGHGDAPGCAFARGGACERRGARDPARTGGRARA